MADPNRHVPNYHDTMQTFDDDESLGLDFEFSDDHPFDENIMLNEDMNQFRNDASQEGPPSVNDQSNAQNQDVGIFNPESSDCGNPIQLSEWPVPAKPYTCTCCQVVREIIHNIDGETRKFEIHGRLGMISHGILEIRRGDDTAPNKEYHMFDFCKESLHTVKNFLVRYCEERKEAGYTLEKDPLLTFYEAVSVGWDWDLGFDFDDILQGSPINIGENIGQPNVSQPQAQGNEVRSNKRPYKEQREITKKLRVKDFVPYFHLPLEAAATQVGVSSTVFKKVCRDGGLQKWPYRKIKSIENKIENRSKSLSTADAAERARAEAEIEQLNQDIAKIYDQFG